MAFQTNFRICGANYSSVFFDDNIYGGTDVVKVDLSQLTEHEVDANGYLVPGVPLSKVGVRIGPGVPVYGVTIQPIKVATGNTETILNAEPDPFVAVGFGLVDRDAAEGNLGRAYTSDEIKGFELAGSNCQQRRI